MKFNVYIDGTWLFYQCAPGNILANRMEFPDNRFPLDFSRLLETFRGQLTERVAATGGEPAALDTGSLYFYTAIFDIPDTPEPEWPDIDEVRRNAEARWRFASGALNAGFDREGIFKVPLRLWIIERLRERRYQEKMVDTSVVARLVEQSIADPERLHLLVSGDLDMLPAIRTVVPDYTDRVVLACTHPDQYNRGEAQSAFRLAHFGFRYDPIFLERSIEGILGGDHVYRCSNPRCSRFFVRPRPVPRGANPICKPCSDTRAG
jgi:hypothetical protein